MTPNSNLDVLLRALDPLSEELDQENAGHRTAVWSHVVAQEAPARPRIRRRRRRRLIGAGSLATVGAGVALVLGLLPGTAPLSAAAATLHHAALADASSATLPSLAAGQYYYQEAQVSMVCQFAKAGGSSNNSWITYVSKGTMQSWTTPSSGGQIIITPTPVNEGGSHFATPADEARWVAEGQPFVPCALANSSNAMIGNPANTNTQSPYGGYATSVSGYSGFGFILGIAQNATATGATGSLVIGAGQTKALSQGANITNLPEAVGQIASMLAAGEINTDGSVSSTPQICPVWGPANSAPGCDTHQQLALIQQLLQLPEASAKLGSVLYDILAQMPGATVATNTTDSFGNVGSTVTVPLDGLPTSPSEFQVVLDPTSGALLSCTALSRVGVNGTSSSTYSPEAAISYGPISVVQGIGALPNATK